jgi:phosphohistidine phosphatase SixA
MVGCFAEPQSVTWTEDLYLSSLTSVVVDAQGWDAAAGAVLCLGHNPGWSAAAFRLSGIRVGMGTAYAALLEGEGDDWAEAFTRPWTLVELLRP